jgi:hypothetical protein
MPSRPMPRPRRAPRPPLRRNLNAQRVIAKIAALICGLVWAYLAMWNAATPDIPLVVIEGTAAACLLYVATELARVK